MKRIISFSVIIALAAAFSACQEPLDELTGGKTIPAGGDFEIQLTITPQTKTVTSDYDPDFFEPGMDQGVEFEEGDRVNLFHCDYNKEGGLINPVDDGCFYVTEVNNGVATLKGYLGEDLELDKSYSWYATYPYSENTKSPSDMYVEFPSSIKVDGDPISALDNSPLAGFAFNILGSKIPQIKMRQIASAVEIFITNMTDDDITIEDVEIASLNDVLRGKFKPEASKGFCDALAGKYEFDAGTWQYNNDDWSTFVYNKDDEIYVRGSAGSMYNSINTIETSQSIKVKFNNPVTIGSYESTSVFVPVAPVVFEYTGVNFLIKVNDVIKPATMRPVSEYYGSDKLIEVRQMFRQGQISRFNFTYGFTDIENTTVEWVAKSRIKNNGKEAADIPKEWFTNSYNTDDDENAIFSYFSCASKFPADYGETDTNNPMTFIWLQSYGHAFTAPSSFGMKYVWEDEGPVFVVPVEHISAGSSAVFEINLSSSTEGDKSLNETETFYAVGGPAYLMCEYSLDQGKTWKAAEVDGPCKYEGDTKANFIFREAGTKYSNKIICPINSDFIRKTLLCRMRCVNAEFSAEDVANNRGIGSRESTLVDCHGEPYYGAGDVSFGPFSGEKYGIFARAYIEQ